MIKMVLFDLDGTLLPMDQDVFVGAYMKGLATAAAPCGYDPKAFVKAVMTGTVAMVRNGGSKPNEEVFWEKMFSILGEDLKAHLHIFDEFYQKDFQKVSEVCGNTPKAAEVIRTAKDRGFRVALATNPLFPKIATESRIKWAGLNPEEFELFTSFETSYFCKPNLNYYREVCDALNVSPAECLMVGNDAKEDMVALELGMKVFMLTDCMINKEGKDISAYPNGSFDDLLSYILDID